MTVWRYVMLTAQFNSFWQTWHEARAYCESAHNGALFSVGSSGERSDVRSWHSSFSDVWVGGYTDNYTIVDPSTSTSSPTTTPQPTTLATDTNCTGSGNFTDDSNCTTTTTNPFTTIFWWWQTTTIPTSTQRLPLSNGFLLDSNARWYWASRGNRSNSKCHSQSLFIRCDVIVRWTLWF